MDPAPASRLSHLPSIQRLERATVTRAPGVRSGSVLGDTTQRLASTMARAVVDMVRDAGLDGWTTVRVHVGIGIALIEVTTPDGAVVECKGTSPAFAAARRNLVQHLRPRFEGALPAFTVTMHAAAPHQPRLAISR